MTFHYIVRAIIRVEGKVLLAHEKSASNTFLPGGHIEPGEGAKAALVREIEEEFGMTPVVGQFIGAVENMWLDDHQNHEINLVFEASVPGIGASQPPESHEAHLEFIWSAPDELATHNLLPSPLIDCITELDAEYKGYWGSSLT